MVAKNEDEQHVAETGKMENMKVFLTRKASCYAHMENTEDFAAHILRNYSLAQMEALGGNLIEQAYNLLHSRETLNGRRCVYD